MNITPVYPQEATQTPGEGASPYDSIWSGTEVPTHQPEGLERVMLAEDKLYVVLAVVLIIWFGLVYFLFRTDRRLERLERTVEQNILSEKP